MWRLANGPSLLVPCVLLLLGCHTTQSSDPGLERYETMMMRDLYKRLSHLDLPLYVSDLQSDLMTSQDGGGEYGDVEGGAAALRDSELIEHSSAAHFPTENDLKPEEETSDKISGGGGGGILPIKVDSNLPSYCHPPNPCPKGYTDSDGCEADVEDTSDAQKDWISTQQQLGYCSCDREHMFKCPEEAEAVVNARDSKQAFNAAVNSILSDRAEPVYLTGEKRKSLVAKKAPRVRRGIGHKAASRHNDKHHVAEMEKVVHKKGNPYLQGERLRTVAKKG